MASCLCPYRRPQAERLPGVPASAAPVPDVLVCVVAADEPPVARSEPGQDRDACVAAAAAAE